jgi:hypothetical protein
MWALLLAWSCTASSESSLLIFDDAALNRTVGLRRRVGTPRLLSTFADPDAFVGWGYPNVWQVRDGSYRMVYNGNWKHQHYPRLILLASSSDGVHFEKKATPSVVLPDRLAMNQMLPTVVGSHSHGTERGTLYDEGPHGSSNRFKMLLSNSSVLESADALQWRLRKHGWAPEKIDPMIGVFRTEREIVVTSRPASLRKNGRHAGYHASSDWDGLESKDAKQSLPLD